MKKLLALLSLLLLLSTNMVAQKYVDEDTPPLERIYFGGNFGLAFSTNYTQIEVSPIVGYMFTEKFSAGPGIIYQYLKANLRTTTGQIYSVQTNIYGGKLFARYNITPQIFAYSEFEALSFEVFQDAQGNTAREVVPSFFLGGGYFAAIGNRAGASIMALYNILYDPYTSPYNSPFLIRVGFNF